MLNSITPKKLSNDSSLMVISPSQSLDLIKEREIANKRFSQIGLKVNYSKNSEISDEFNSSLVKDKISDFNSAFSNKNIDLIISSIGGYNANEILSFIDFENIKNNPKMFCGFSDITVLLNAIYAKTGLITYHGPHYSSFCEKLGFDYTFDYFKKMLFEENDSIEIFDSKTWSSDMWWIDQEKRNFIKNDGRKYLNKILGNFEGTILGGELTTFQLLFGTEYMPDLKDSILFLETTSDTDLDIVIRILFSLSNQKNFDKVKAILFGRFEKNIDVELLKSKLVGSKIFNSIPIIYNLNFGHTEPFFTFPIGGKCLLKLNKEIQINISDKNI